MRKLAIGAALVVLSAATPALAEGNARGSPSGGTFDRHFVQAISSAWRSAFSAPPGFSSPGRHFGWLNGKHWGWFKPKNPHWPHHPPQSP